LGWDNEQEIFIIVPKSVRWLFPLPLLFSLPQRERTYSKLIMMSPKWVCVCVCVRERERERSVSVLEWWLTQLT
jgi:hypothetical protein